MHQVDGLGGDVAGHDRLLVQDPARDVLVKTDGNKCHSGNVQMGQRRVT